MPHLREIQPGDLDTICRHRARMFLDSGRPEPAVVAMAEPFRRWLEPRLLDGTYFGWLVEDADVPGAVIGGLGMMELDWPPHPLHPSDARRGYILNVYVEPEFRRRGIAAELMQKAREDAVRRKLSYLILHATADGQPLYRGLGWTPTAEMALSITPPVE